MGVFCPAASHQWPSRRTSTYMAISENGRSGSKLGDNGFAIWRDREPCNMRDDNVFADRQRVTDPIAEFHFRRGLLLETDMDRMEAFVTLHQSAVWAAPDNVRRELAVQHLGISLVMAGLETGRKCLCHSSSLDIHTSDSSANGHD